MTPPTGAVMAELDKLIDATPPEGRSALVVQLSARVAAAAAGMVALPASGNGQAEDRNLSAREAARRLGVSRPYLYKHADEFPFTIRDRRKVVFSARGMEDWCRQRMTARRP